MQNDTWMSGFISGLVCGEGNFTIAIAKQPHCKLGYHVRAIFQIELHIADAGLLKKVKAFFGVGGINHPKPRTRVRNESPTCRYFVTAIPDCKKLVEFFRANPLVGVKQQAFEVWAQCLEVIAAGRHTSSEGFNQIVEMRAGINQIRRPSTFRAVEQIEATDVSDGRRLATWTAEEETQITRYLAGQITRGELNKIIGRSVPSISNKIKRMRRE